MSIKKILTRSFLVMMSLSILASSQVKAITNAELYHASDTNTTFIDYDCIDSSVDPDANKGSTGGLTDEDFEGREPMEVFVEKYYQDALAVQKGFGISYEIVLAQAAHESDYARSGLTRDYNNFFGIKAGSRWEGEVANLNTQEQTPDGEVYEIKDGFRVYKDSRAGFLGYGHFVAGNDRYSAAVAAGMDEAKYPQELFNAGYATDVKYVTKFKNAIASVKKITEASREKYKNPSDVLSSPITPDAAKGGASDDPNLESPQPNEKSSVDVSGILPAETIKKLENEKVKEKVEKLKERYLYAEENFDINWQMMAALHYRESGYNPNTTMMDGDTPLGGGLSKDSIKVGKDWKEDMEFAVAHLKDKASSHYQIELTKDTILVDEVGTAFLSWNKGNMYGLWDEEYSERSEEAAKDAYASYVSVYGAGMFNDKNKQLFDYEQDKFTYKNSPYVMNNYDEEHMDMNWLISDSFTRPDASKAKKWNDTYGKKDSNSGALAVYVYLGGKLEGVDSPDEICQKEGSNQNGGDIVGIAEQELSKSPVEYDSNVLVYTTGRQEAWCADFVSWVYNEAGKPITGNSEGAEWQIPSVVNMQSVFKENHTYFKVGEQEPQPGDVAFYIGAQTPDGGSSSHVNIVVEVNGGTMTTIGGNEGDAIKKGERKIQLGASGLVGFGRIE